MEAGEVMASARECRRTAIATRRAPCRARSLLIGAALAAGLMAGARITAFAGEEPDMSTLEPVRRVIFNDDSEELAYPEGGTVEGFLSVRLAPLVGTDVTTINWSVLGICGDAPVYDSRAQPIFGVAHGGASQPQVPRYVPNIRKLVEAGTCPLKIVTDFAHGHGLEAFASVRMNDVHDSGVIAGMQTLWKQEHPEYLVRSPHGHRIHSLYDTAQDYAHEAVRQRKFEIIDEIGRRYDIDGVELDFVRHPVLFSSVMGDGPATEQEIGIVTDFIRRIRARLRELAAARGRPILLAVRTPDTVRQSRRIGLDLEAWMAGGLIDIWIVGGGYAPEWLAVEPLTTLAHRHGVQVYPCNNWATRGFGEAPGGFVASARALAASWYHQGADGVYFWNVGTPFLEMSGAALERRRAGLYAALKGVGDPEAAAGGERFHWLDAPVFEPYVFISSAPALPIELSPHRWQSVPWSMGDIHATDADGDATKATLTLLFAGDMAAEDLEMRLNGFPCAADQWQTVTGKRPGRRALFDIAPDILRPGANRIDVKRDPMSLAPPHPPVLHTVFLQVPQAP